MLWSHSGAIGDIIYHIPVIRELGGGDLRIIPAQRDGYRTREDMQYQALKALLARQPYLTSVAWSDVPVGICFDAWRQTLNFQKNLTNQAAAWLGLTELSDNCEPWLEVGEAKAIAPVVVAHSGRNYDPRFPWARVLAHYGRHVVFIGTAAEHQWFTDHFGAVPHYPTADMLAAAQVIKGSKLFIGNPSAPLAVAEGLKHPCIAASFPAISHCVFYHRPGQQHCWESVDLWAI